MRLSTTLLLLVLVAGLLIFIIAVEHEAPGTQEKLERQIRPFSFQPDEAFQIEMNTGEDQITLQRTPSGWLIEQPIKDHANPDKIKTLLEAAANLEWLQTFQRKDLGRGDLSDSGLNDSAPLFTIKNDKGETLATLRLGAASAIEGAIYATSDPNPEPQSLHLTRSPLSNLLPINAAEWRDQRLLRVKADNVLSLSLDTATSAMEFERDPATRSWNLIKPLRTRASNERVNAILGAILNLESSPPQPNTPKPGDSTLAPLVIRITTTNDTKPKEITLQANADPTQPVRAEINDRPDHYQTTNKAHDLWRLQPNHLRDQQLARFDAASVLSLRIQSVNHGEVLMNKVSGEWMLKRFGKTEPANHERIAQLLDRLNIEQIREFISDSATNLEPYGLDKPFLEVSWDIAQTTTTLTFGSGADNQVFARYKDAPHVYRISPSLFTAIPPDITKWRSTKIINASVFAARRLIIAKGEAPALTLQYQADQSSWTGTLANNDITPKIDTAAANEYLQQLLNFTASDWSSDRRDAYIALKNPTLTLQLTLVQAGEDENNAKAQTLIFAPTQPGMDTAIYHGRLDGDPDTFLITRELYRQLTVPLIKE
ncbi:DUF4340 domain-containing protein [Phragmitibacter flavus]|uniref:DUF4340 domain-containing protein n=1 Tax=Phragmitibacter flavus TaxID=2576071 RepID=A0A5R8K954_9BACT|nr:DUF4340 domain-containing protein [Phragmitibacter flavus]TLD68846.1 DUF4340 domain-containing protein [Phragmitibacter flavus]